jgi:hypothetical protein
LRNLLEETEFKNSDIVINAQKTKRLPNTSSIISNIDADY